MVDIVRKSLRDSKLARWTALLIVSFTMMCGYFVADIMSPLKPMLERELQWSSTDYGFFTGAYAWFNVFLAMLVIGGIILDKKGPRFAGLLACVLMVAGCGAKYFALTKLGTELLAGHKFLGINSQVVTAAVGYAVFGVGIEICGITATKIIARWFKGYSMALAMGLQVSTARIGTAVAIGTGGAIATQLGSVSIPVLIGVEMLCLGFVAFVIYADMDRELDASESDSASEPEDQFRLSDIKQILQNRGFWYIAILCALFYSAVFPFLKYASDLMVNKFDISESKAGLIPALLPFATIPLTVVFGGYYDRKGKGATMLALGSLLLLLAHAIFAIPIVSQWYIALLATIVLGFGFALVPSAMWPSVPKLIPQRQLGTAYALIFFLQNLVALMGIPYLIGWVLDNYCVTGQRIVDGESTNSYNYTTPMMIFALLGMLAVLVAVLLKVDDKRKGYGLELPIAKK